MEPPAETRRYTTRIEACFVPMGSAPGSDACSMTIYSGHELGALLSGIQGEGDRRAYVELRRKKCWKMQWFLGNVIFRLFLT